MIRTDTDPGPNWPGIPHRFQPKPEGHEGGPNYCTAPCHGHRTMPYHQPAITANQTTRQEPTA